MRLVALFQMGYAVGAGTLGFLETALIFRNGINPNGHLMKRLK
tara:strand:- start:303 stop:431 length:129 start_codon:yes stop_codon:yes gene_type:complete